MSDYKIVYDEPRDLFTVVVEETEFVLRMFEHRDEAQTYIENLSVSDY